MDSNTEKQESKTPDILMKELVERLVAAGFKEDNSKVGRSCIRVYKTRNRKAAQDVQTDQNEQKD